MNPPMSEAASALSWQATLAARLAQPKPTFIYSCDNCHEEVPWTRCKSNERGNEGHWMAMCNKFSSNTQAKCNFFRWARGPSGSPTLPSGNFAPPVIQLDPVPQPTSLGAAAILLICVALICKKRAHSLCGCSVKGHTAAAQLDPTLELRTRPSSEPAALLPPLPAVVTKPVLALTQGDVEPGLDQPLRVDKGKGRALESHDSNIDPALLFLPNPNPAGPSRTIVSSSQPKWAAPRYATQMPAIFTQQNAHEEELQEDRCQQDLERVQAAQREKNTVVVYAWSEDGIEPVIYEFQDGFKLPNFSFSLDILRKLGMVSHSDNILTATILPIQRYNRLLGTWTRFDVDHMVSLQERDNGVLLVKDAHVKDCIDLERHLHQLAQPGSPNMMMSLAEERKYMRAASRTHSSRAPSLLPTDPAIDIHQVPTMNHGSHAPSLPSAAAHRVPTINRALKTGGCVPRVPFHPHNGGSVLSLTDDDNDNEPNLTSKRRYSSALSLTDSDDGNVTNTVRPVKRQLKQHRRSHSESSSSSSHSPSSIISVPIVKRESAGSLLSHGTSQANAIEVEKVSIWPTDFYIVDIADGFAMCRMAAMGRRSMADVFAGHFGVPFKASTFYDNQKVWQFSANHGLCERFIEYGRTEKGSWSAFMKKARRPPK
ncbi:uncharacterized protein F5147DRAFT_778570 [Suillus discolor]|uniref:Uncharacterized protein n=1 Tax=Suillus discolor TaxID=1912936 RepID=A0A9P7JPQ1_9AGAM|nr:uncharacterized protein F5147DRAFT_778570 [Suillus discolor]KAG2095666.1 hypothetical protein F5147DRAFT_778570 [Suillus discolor]